MPGYGVGRKMLITGNKISVVRGEYVHGITTVAINIYHIGLNAPQVLEFRSQH